MKSKFLLTLFTVICTLCCVISFAACGNLDDNGNKNEDNTTTDKNENNATAGLKYELINDETAYIVSGYRSNINTDLIIPASYQELPVIGIGEKAFYKCSSIKTVTIPYSVTEIKSGAFNACASLTKVTINEGVTYIGSYAFCYCPLLNSVTLPKSVNEIYPYAFGDCSSLKNLDFNGTKEQWYAILKYSGWNSNADGSKGKFTITCGNGEKINMN